MSKKYQEFKMQTLKAEAIIRAAKDMRSISEEFAQGFEKAMWEAREIFMRIEDKEDSNND